jgi:sec-independent protein translocase protein TatB
MFGVDFSELALIFIVALVVLGPTRLPGLVRKVGRWVGKARMMARDFQQQLESEINIEEINRAARKTVDDAMSMTPARTEPEPEAPATPVVDEEARKLAESGYPYGIAEPEAQSLAATEPATAEPAAMQAAPGDDTYSHAHGHDSAPMADEGANSLDPPPAPLADGGAYKKDDAAA